MSFPYDVETLIKLVEERPCLWDKSQEYYKSKNLRHKAWIEIYHCLEEKYGELTIKEKKQVGIKITTKWVNIKDAFIKTLKKKFGHEPKRRYIYANQLQFLLNKKKECPVKSSIGLGLKKEQDDEDNLIIPSDFIYVNQVPSSLPKSPNRKSISTKITDDMDTLISEELEAPRYDPLTSNMGNDDKFFQSFVPYIRDMTENERIDLQMDLLSSIKRIKENRRQNYSLKVTSQTWPTSDD